MNKRITGTLVGLLCSLIAVGLWILLSAVLGIIAGLAGAAMGILFLLPYMKINPEDKSAYPYVFGGILILVEIIASELISLAIMASMAGVDFGELLEGDGTVLFIVLDIVIGVVLSGLVFGFYIYDIRKKQTRVNRSRTDTSRNVGDDTQPSENVFDEVKDDTSGVKDDTHTDDKPDGSGWRTD